MSAGETLSIAQSVAFALLSALEGEPDGPWAAWAHGWLRGDDRSAAVARAAGSVAATPAARAAAEAAIALEEATTLETEAAMLESEGRNARWTLDTAETRKAACLAAASDAMRSATTRDATPISPARKDELRDQAARSV